MDILMLSDRWSQRWNKFLIYLPSLLGKSESNVVILRILLIMKRKANIKYSHHFFLGNISWERRKFNLLLLLTNQDYSSYALNLSAQVTWTNNIRQLFLNPTLSPSEFIQEVQFTSSGKIKLHSQLRLSQEN